MAARPRRARESYSAYRGNLRDEEYATKRRLRGFILWPGERGTARRSVVNGVNVLTNGKVAVRVPPLLKDI